MTHRPARPPRRHASATAVLLGALAAAAAAACSEVPTSPDEPFALGFDRLPFPAVVIGDTLRDSAGAAVSLRSVTTVYNAAGAPIPDAPVDFLALDRGIRVTAEGFVLGDSLRTGARVVARVGDIPSEALAIDVVPRPDSLERVSAEQDTVLYTVPTDPAQDESNALTVRVLHVPGNGDPEGDAIGGVASWPVRYTLTVYAPTEAPDDSALVWLADAGRRTTVATANTAGEAALRVRVNGNRGGELALIDSVVVYVSADSRGAPLRGSPVRFVVLVGARAEAETP